MQFMKLTKDTTVKNSDKTYLFLCALIVFNDMSVFCVKLRTAADSFLMIVGL